jgi:hypothetical protein
MMKALKHGVPPEEFLLERDFYFFSRRLLETILDFATVSTERCI